MTVMRFFVFSFVKIFYYITAVQSRRLIGQTACRPNSILWNTFFEWKSPKVSGIYRQNCFHKKNKGRCADAIMASSLEEEEARIAYRPRIRIPTHGSVEATSKATNLPYVDSKGVATISAMAGAPMQVAAKRIPILLAYVSFVRAVLLSVLEEKEHG